jgi:putative lipoprotein
VLACFALAAPTAFAASHTAPVGAWRVEAIGTTPLAAAARPDITFTAEGRAHGSSGCNRFLGGFTLDGAALRFEPIAGTRMACESPAMELERHFLEALAAVHGWRMDGPALLLTNGAGATVLRLRRSEAE